MYFYIVKDVCVFVFFFLWKNDDEFIFLCLDEGNMIKEGKDFLLISIYFL